MTHCNFPPSLAVDAEVIRVGEILTLGQVTLHRRGTGQYGYRFWGESYVVEVTGARMIVTSRNPTAFLATVIGER